MTSRPSDPSDPPARAADAADAAASSCAELARWCDDADPEVRRDERTLARAERHLANCTTCRDRFSAELRFWAALAAPEVATAADTPNYRPPSLAFASDVGAGAASPKPKVSPSPKLNPMRLVRIAVLTIVGTVIAFYALIADVRLIGGRPSVDAPTSRESADLAAPEVEPRFRPQFVTRAATGAPTASPSELRRAVLTVRSADAPPAPVFAQSFSVEQRTPSSTSLLTFESAARTLAVRAP